MTDVRVGHVVSDYLAASETFVYTQLRHALDPPVVLARRVKPDHAFPFDPLLELGPYRAGRFNAELARRARRLVPSAAVFPRRLARAAREQGCDLLHAHFGWTAETAVPAARATGLPLVTTFYGRDVYSPRWGRRVPRSQYRGLWRDGSRFLCLGPRMRDALVRAGAPAGRVQIVPLGLDLSRFAFSDHPPPGPLTLIQVGRLTEKKGFETTIRAYALARSEVPESRLWIIGEGPQKTELVELTSQLGLADAVTFLGHRSHEEVAERLGQAHIGMHPSCTAQDGDREGTPTAILEMQAVGLPVVATDHSDIPSIVPRPSRLTPERDADGLATQLVEVAAMPREARLELAREGRRLVERRHDARVVARQLHAVYRECLAETRTR